MRSIALRCAAPALGLGLMVATLATPAGAQMRTSQEIIERARITVEALRHDADLAALNAYLARAKGVLVVPSLYKAGFFFGAEGGSGVLMSRTPAGEWGYPAFVTLGAEALAMTLGGQNTEIIFVIMSDDALSQVARNPVRFGADTTLAAGPTGAGASAATGPTADIYYFTKTRGLSGGGSFDGTVLYPREERNSEFYGQPASAREIVLAHKFASNAAESLRAALADPR